MPTNHTSATDTRCITCTQPITPPARAALGYTTCLRCGDKAATAARKSWCVLTPHKQGAMFFTAQTAREAAVGINNKGGLTK